MLPVPSDNADNALIALSGRLELAASNGLDLDAAELQRVVATNAPALAEVRVILQRPSVVPVGCGAGPTRLSDLAPDFLSQLPVDPVAGGDFHYESTGEDFSIQRFADAEVE
ncbi:MAG: hypothetical protein KF688_16855 [Pirellulales bacterium]|nr:hypothetical protein [Pirellulales bacterium]